MSLRVCRLCLKKSPVYYSLLDNNVASMLEALALNKVSPDDEISTTVCIKCLLSLKWAYTFQQRVRKSETKLLERMKIKQEPILRQEIIKLANTKETTSDLVKLCNETCVICGVIAYNKSINDHIREHLNNKQMCDFCNKSFIDTHLYRQHLLQHPEKAIHECTNCHARFQYKAFYDLHVTAACSLENYNVQKRIATLGLHSKQAISLLRQNFKKPIALHEVNEETQKRVFQLGLRSSKAIKLLLGHEEKKDDTRTCNVCFKERTSNPCPCHNRETKTCTICSRAVSKCTFKKHMDDHSLGPQICHFCGATLRNRSCLHAHIFYSHNDFRYKCTECDKQFRKKSARDLHVQKEHIGKPTHYCDTCGKGFFSDRFLQKHIKMKHLKLRPHICEFCEKGFSSQYALKTHRRQHTNETPYRCEVCGEGFKQNVSLRAHRKSKHNIVEENTCSCKVCGKGFASSSALLSHMRFH